MPTASIPPLSLVFGIPSLDIFRYNVTNVATFVVAFVVLKTVFAVALTMLFYGVVGLAAATIAVQVVKKLKS